MKFAPRKMFASSLCCCVLFLSMLPVVATAAEMNLDYVFSDGAVPPGNASTPWLKYSVLNQAPNSVLFTLTATANMTDPENIKSFYFNFDDTLTVADLNFSLVGTAGAFTLPTVSKDMNNLKADGDGYYDLLLEFDTSGGLASYFNSGDSLSYLLTYNGVGSMTEGSFQFLSVPDGGAGIYYAAAHILSTPGGGSGSAWLGATTVTYPEIPEPSTAALVVAALAVVGLRRSRV